MEVICTIKCTQRNTVAEEQLNEQWTKAMNAASYSKRLPIYDTLALISNLFRSKPNYVIESS